MAGAHTKAAAAPFEGSELPYYLFNCWYSVSQQTAVARSISLSPSHYQIQQDNGAQTDALQLPAAKQNRTGNQSGATVLTSSASLLCGEDAAIMTLGSLTAQVPVRCASAIFRRSHRAAALSQMPCTFNSTLEHEHHGGARLWDSKRRAYKGSIPCNP
jgi:hypothetical protein